MKILNIHGFDGHCYNSNFQVLKKLGHDVVSPQLDYRFESPIQIMSQLLEISFSDDFDLIVATSFGAFFAKMLSIITGKHCILTNPCLRPDISLKKLAPEYFTRKNDLIIEKGVRFLWNRADYSGDIIIIGDDDEVIDHYDITLWEAFNAKFYHIPGGKHRLEEEQLDPCLKEALEYYG